MQSFAEKLEQKPVYDRIHTGFEVPGAQLGGLTLYPSAKLLEIFSDNIYATQNSKRSDFITTITPALRVETSNPNYGFKARAASEHALYRQYDGENYNDYHAGFEPFLRLRKNTKILGKLGFDQEHDARTSPAASNNLGSDEPVKWQRSIGKLGWEYKPGRLGFTAFAGREIRRYQNVDSFINNDRDRTNDSIDAMLSCDLTDQNKIYVTLSGFKRDYERPDFDTGFGRNSAGYESRLGLSGMITPLIRLDVNGGYYSQNFDQNFYGSVQSFTGLAKVSWQVTALTTLDFKAKRDVFETIQPDASAFIQNHVSAGIAHELRRNIIIGLEAGAGVNDYVGSSREDRYWGMGPSVTYKMNRNLYLKADYLYDERRSNQPLADYDRQRVSVGLQVQF